MLEINYCNKDQESQVHDLNFAQLKEILIIIN